MRTLKIRDVIKMIERDGWKYDDLKRGHHIYTQPTEPGKVTVSGHPSDKAHPKSLRSMLKQAGLR